ncbi:MAG TPA: sugar kinase [Acetobacteraceae bacterium]|jgi:2-dehydro-3-deoxygluconokinase|nr:sugar kinase [Acetobacteraceae bacterium]
MAVDLLCMGEPMLEFNQLPQAEDGRVLYLEGHGGDTSNAAIAAARQGARVGYITAIGQDAPGDSLMALWEREGVDTETVIRTDRALTAVYFVTHDAKGHQFLHYRKDSPAALYGPRDLPRAAIANAKIFFASGISQGISTSASDAVFAAIDIARGNGVTVAYDTNYRPRLWPPTRAAAVMHAAIARCDIVLPGMEDAAVLTGLADPNAILDFYLRLGPKIVVLKMGEEGAYIGTPDGRMRIESLEVRSVDATGAGDAFCGSYLARVLTGDTAEQAARYAVVAAALKCTGYGAVAPIPFANDVRAALRNM